MNKNVLLGCGIAAAVVVLLIGGCGMIFYRAVSGFPEHARREAVYSAHKDVIDQVNSLIVASHSLAQTQQSIAAATWPEKVVYIKLRDAQSAAKPNGQTKRSRPGTGAKDDVDAFKRFTWTSNTVISMNGSGYGTLRGDRGAVSIVIVDNSQLNAANEEIKYTIYIEHAPPAKK